MFRCSEKAYELCKDKDSCGERTHAYYLSGSECEKFNIEVAQKEIKERDNWIRVEDKLPPEHDSMFAKFYNTNKWGTGMFRSISDTVNVVVERTDGSRKVLTAYTTDGKWNSLLRMIELKVTHWQPLPEPPKGD